jgi:hypothetical protein
VYANHVPSTHSRRAPALVNGLVPRVLLLR